jgi:hypothetical protein
MLRVETSRLGQDLPTATGMPCTHYAHETPQAQAGKGNKACDRPKM